jgi:ABC-2 type transport system ATP-binding protein
VEGVVTDGLAIETVDLWKRYADAEALRGLTLQVPAGSICGFLGRNGAGKTTAIKVLLGMAHADRGEARVLGRSCAGARDGAAVRGRIGFVSEEKDLYGSLGVTEMIAFTRAFYPRWRADLERQYLRVFELPGHRTIHELSRGARTKLALLLALCRGAELLVLDEPTSGLDPAAADEVLQALVTHVAGEQATVFFSSHQLAEVEQIADRVVIVDRGQAVVAGELDELRARIQRIELVFDGEAPHVTLRSAGVQRVQRRGRVVTVLASVTDGAVLDELRGYRPSSLEVAPVSLKELFLESVRTEE